MDTLVLDPYISRFAFLMIPCAVIGVIGLATAQSMLKENQAEDFARRLYHYSASIAAAAGTSIPVIVVLSIVLYSFHSGGTIDALTAHGVFHTTTIIIPVLFYLMYRNKFGRSILSGHKRAEQEYTASDFEEYRLAGRREMRLGEIADLLRIPQFILIPAGILMPWFLFSIEIELTSFYGPFVLGILVFAAGVIARKGRKYVLKKKDEGARFQVIASKKYVFPGQSLDLRIVPGAEVDPDSVKAVFEEIEENKNSEEEGKTIQKIKPESATVLSDSVTFYFQFAEDLHSTFDSMIESREAFFTVHYSISKDSQKRGDSYPIQVAGKDVPVIVPEKSEYDKSKYAMQVNPANIKLDLIILAGFTLLTTIAIGVLTKGTIVLGGAPVIAIYGAWSMANEYAENATYRIPMTVAGSLFPTLTSLAIAVPLSITGISEYSMNDLFSSFTISFVCFWLLLNPPDNSEEGLKRRKKQKEWNMKTRKFLSFLFRSK